jgi:hypothetical protein
MDGIGLSRRVDLGSDQRKRRPAITKSTKSQYRNTKQIKKLKSEITGYQPALVWMKRQRRGVERKLFPPPF